MDKYVSVAEIRADVEWLQSQGVRDLDLREVLERIELLIPAAEVAEVRHGRLEYAPYNGVYDAKCSNCGYSPGIKFWDSPYCPNCGALMLEDEHEAD